MKELRLCRANLLALRNRENLESESRLVVDESIRLLDRAIVRSRVASSRGRKKIIWDVISRIAMLALLKGLDLFRTHGDFQR